ncbi:Urb2/Npa2 family-domain-containing protein [Emericellopsis atlantica]|uniref:Urb2/Npa2 family-domain-containing protein n=1 Tax=Emericellopsis atlantica TaxID=2614577 RepID=A0A9P7ZS01_9HYPO|nr:Urb2/Npa2 family-domain-containing protein [Emericellopsis atlantica]KAG9257258.1 Urb2/Npa2 family-domain-containing protein [Emericellopsis atlantica]
MSEAELIKTVRGLDQSGPGENGEKLVNLWRCLTASADSHFHAAEQSCLRWLLKSMNGSTRSAETLRRYPMTWRLLDCVFQRIPLFSLAKSLADRKFVAVLQQALKDVSHCQDDHTTATSSKRKRSPPATFALESLTTRDGCAESGQAIFTSLRTLTRRIGDTTTTSSHDKVGAEHLASLFASPASEAATLAAPLLRICDVLLESGSFAEATGSEDWIDVVASLWHLHLQGEDDATEVARHLFGPASAVVVKVEGLAEKGDMSIPNTIRDRWSSGLRTFMHRTLILPARSTFLSHQNVDVITKALARAELDSGAPATNTTVTAPALYLLASTATQVLIERGVRRGNSEWMKRVFQAAEASIHEREDRASVMNVMLKQARESKVPVSANDLRVVCRQYALQDGETDWKLVANLTQCEPDVFQGSAAGTELLKEICERSVAPEAEQHYDAVLQVIDAIVKGFRNARTFSTFLRLWFEQLVAVEGKKSRQRSPWTSIGRGKSPILAGTSWVEDSCSVSEVNEMLDWIDSLKPQPESLCLWLNAVSQGIHSDVYKDALGQKIFNVILKVPHSNTDISALKWRVVSKAVACAPISQRADNMALIKGDLKKILKKRSLNTAETFEAFKCCCRLWVAFSPDGDQDELLADLIGDFDDGLGSREELKAQSLDFVIPDGETDNDFSSEHALPLYVAWCLQGSTRFSRLFFNRKSELPLAVSTLLNRADDSKSTIGHLWQTLLDNEHCINETKLAGMSVDRTIDAFTASQKNGNWPDGTGNIWLRSIATVPLDALSRAQRERVMLALVTAGTSPKTAKKISLDSWKAMFSLSAKLMSRSTFYEGMAFQHLLDMANYVVPSVNQSPAEALSELVERFSAMATATIQRVAEHVEKRSAQYLEEAAVFVKQCEEAFKEDKSQRIPALHLTLLKTLSKLLWETKSLHHYDLTASLPANATTALKEGVLRVIQGWASEKKLFSSPQTDMDLGLFAAVDAADVAKDLPELSKIKSTSLHKLEERSAKAMEAGDVRGWRVQTLLQRFVPMELQKPRPATFHNIQGKGREAVLRQYVVSIVKAMPTAVKMMYLESLLGEYLGGCHTDGQLIAIHYVVGQLIEATDLQISPGEYDLAQGHSDLTRALATSCTAVNSVYICRTLCQLLENKPQAMTQWNVEVLLGTIASLSSDKITGVSPPPFIWMCKLVEVVIKKHRLRLEGHYHILLSVLQALLRNLIDEQPSTPAAEGPSQETKAGAFARLVTLVCEPTAGAVSRAQPHSALDSATDAAKRSAGRHMYLVLMQYVKLQLESHVSRGVREALEPAMNSIFDITPPEGRKILNDAMDASGRAVLREMFKRYTRFGKWTGV